ncbi:MAG TPA: Vms1/Ankzf1 family peptidyl-tRNA hydrolase [Actinomycetota bacterium]|nr:Vms1/Ankzf1 family peptidyl-tRNA hydrolase [Actinomycetota bacterium]
MAAQNAGTRYSRRIRELARTKVDNARVISLYLNLDHTEFPTRKEWTSEMESLIDRAMREAQEGGLAQEVVEALKQDADRVRSWVTQEFDPKGVGSLAIFACSPSGLWETIELPGSVRSSVSVGESPVVEPLVEALPDDSWCVFLVNRRSARVLRGNRERLVERIKFQDDVHGQHDQGGWSQARFQRSVEEEVKDHVKKACETVFESFQRSGFDRLLVGAAEELWPEVQEKLHDYVKQRLVGRFDVEVEHSSPEDVLQRALPAIEQDERQREGALLELLSQELATGGRAASGLEKVLEALNERRVDTLLLQPGYQAPGVSCPNCGWAGVKGNECPLDRTALQEEQDIVESAVELTIVQSGEVKVLQHQALDDRGPVAALLRY